MDVLLSVSPSALRHSDSSIQVFCLRRDKKEEEVCTSETEGEEKLENEKEKRLHENCLQLMLH
jgi:hypothetical protein